MILILQALALGVLQGLTEFIPVSSSAHLIILPWLFSWKTVILESLAFDMALHLGTLAAILVYFASDWKRMFLAGFRSVVERKIGEDGDRRMAWFLVLGCIPGGLAGLLLSGKIEAFFHAEVLSDAAMITVAAGLAIMGALLFAAERLSSKNRPIGSLTFRDALIIGMAQALAIFPGVSRSGSTLTAGLALGLEREAATRFSFLLSAPLITGAGMMSVLKISQAIRRGEMAQGDLMLVGVGFLAAAASGFACIHLLLRFVRRHPVDVFVYYRWALALLVVLVVCFR
jgi:undecaprenyl-diphosphatase